MNDIAMLFENKVLGVALLSWLIAQVLKVIILLITTRRLDLTRIVGSGGMPSSHAAFVVSLAMGVGYSAGFDSALFALASVFALVVMYDAAGVRRAAGKQAKLLNRMMVDLFEAGKKPQEETLKELLGHTPVEVFAGAVVGAMAAAWLM